MHMYLFVHCNGGRGRVCRIREFPEEGRLGCAEVPVLDSWGLIPPRESGAGETDGAGCGGKGG